MPSLVQLGGQLLKAIGWRLNVKLVVQFPEIWFTGISLMQKGPFGPLLDPPEGLRAPGVPGVNPGGRLQESGGDF